MGWKKFIFGEKVPDKDDPKYQKKRRQANEAGAKFVRATKLDKASGWLQGFAMRHPKVFFAIIGCIIMYGLFVSVSRLSMVFSPAKEETEMIRAKEILQDRHLLKNVTPINQDKHDKPTATDKED